MPDGFAERPPLERVAVVGTCGVGKTTFASALGARLEAPHVELDARFWNPDWKQASEPEFRERVRGALAPPRWVCDGNYAAVRDLVWGQATALIWLNLPFPTLLSRLLRRSLRRARTGEAICGDNRESLAQTFLSSESILLWAVRSHRRNLRELPAAREADYPELPLIELKSPGEVDRFLSRAR